MRRLTHAIPILAVLWLMGGTPLFGSTSAQGTTALYYEPGTEIQSGVRQHNYPTSSGLNSVEDRQKPFYQEWIDWIKWYFDQSLDKLPALSEVFSAFRGLKWKQQAAWSSLGVALLLGIYFRLRSLRWRAIHYPEVTRLINCPPSDMPAPAVSVLESQEVSDRTILSALVELCQNDLLEVVNARRSVGRRQQVRYTYRRAVGGSPRYEWERLLLDAIPRLPVTVDGLRLYLKDYGTTEFNDLQSGQKKTGNDRIGRLLGEHLRQHRLFNDNPVSAKAKNEPGCFSSLVWLFGMLLSAIGSGLLLHPWLSSWLSSSPSWANIGLSVFGGIIVAIIYVLITANDWEGHITPTETGLREISRWLKMEESLPRRTRLELTDPLVAYAIALDSEYEEAGWNWIERWSERGMRSEREHRAEYAQWFDRQQHALARGEEFDEPPP